MLMDYKGRNATRQPSWETSGSWGVFLQGKRQLHKPSRTTTTTTTTTSMTNLNDRETQKFRKNASQNHR
jgi:hypothetical protein